MATKTRRHSCFLLALALLLILVTLSCKKANKEYILQYNAAALLTGIAGTNQANIYAISHVYANKGKVYSYDGHDWREQADLDVSPKGITVTRDDEVWVAGGYSEYDEEEKRYKGRIYYFDGSKWHQQYQSDHTIEGIFALDKEHIWAVDDDGGVHFYDGSAWSLQQSIEVSLRSVYALDDSHAWAVGNELGSTRKSYVYFYNGFSWNQQAEFEGGLWDVFAIDENDVLACGFLDQETGVIYRFDGSSWNKEYEAQGGMIRSLYALNSQEVWAAGERKRDPSKLSIESSIYYFNGENWDEAFIIEDIISDVWVNDRRSLWATGGYGNIYYIDNEE